MGRGILSGIIWGVIVAGGFLAGLSLVSPLPEGARESAVAATEVEVPAASPFNQPPADEEPEVPAADAEVAAQTPEAPEAAPSALPEVLTEPAAQPNTVAETPSVTAPVETDAPQVSDTVDPAAPPPEFQPGPLDVTLPQISEIPVDEEEPALPVEESSSAIEDPEVANAGLAPIPAPAGPALEVNAAPFVSTSGLPFFSIILIDTPDGTVDRATLSALSAPITIGVEASAPDAAATVDIYRAAGFEVVTVADAGFIANPVPLPGTVAVIDGLGRVLEQARSTRADILEVLATTGHGLLFFEAGLNSAVASAQRDGIPAMTLYSLLDGENERSTVITRYLDRATFAAGQEQQAIVVGRNLSDTVTAVLAWQQSSRSQTVQIAPVSHILKTMGLDR